MFPRRRAEQFLVSKECDLSSPERRCFWVPAVLATPSWSGASLRRELRGLRWGCLSRHGQRYPRQIAGAGRGVLAYPTSLNRVNRPAEACLVNVFCLGQTRMDVLFSPQPGLVIWTGSRWLAGTGFHSDQTD